MRQASRCFLSILISLLLALEALSAPAQQTIGGITGVVRYEKGAVVPEALVTLVWQGSRRQDRLTSGADGEFTFQAPEGEYVVTVARPGFPLLRLEGIMVKSGESTEIQPVLSELRSDLKRELLSIPAGKIVEVKLKPGGKKKIQGRLGQITDESFEVQKVTSGQVSTETIAFADVESVKKRGMHPAAKAAIIIGAAAGIAYVAIFGWIAIAER